MLAERRGWARVASATLVLSLGLAIPAVICSPPAHAASTGQIAGRLADGTRGARLPRGLSVTVGMYKNGSQVATWRTMASSDGSFTFVGLPIGARTTYRVMAVYHTVPYVTGPVTLSPAAPRQRVTVTIYEVSHDRTVVHARALAVVLTGIDRARQRLGVLEVASFRNRSDRTYLPTAIGPDGPMGLLRFSLPPEAVDVQPVDRLANSTLVAVDKGFATDMPLLPGSTDVTFSYMIGYQENTYRLRLTLPYGAPVTRLLVPAGLLTVRSAPLQLTRPVSIGGHLYTEEASRAPFAARTTLTVDLTDLPLALPPGQLFGSIPLVAAVWPAMAVPLLLGLGALLWRRQGDETPLRTEPGHQDKQLPDDQTALLREIARLDGSYRAGVIAEDDYRRHRDAVKLQVIELVLREGSVRHIAMPIDARVVAVEERLT